MGKELCHFLYHHGRTRSTPLRRLYCRLTDSCSSLTHRSHNGDKEITRLSCCCPICLIGRCLISSTAPPRTFHDTVISSVHMGKVLLEPCRDILEPPPHPLNICEALSYDFVGRLGFSFFFFCETVLFIMSYELFQANHNGAISCSLTWFWGFKCRSKRMELSKSLFEQTLDGAFRVLKQE